MTAKTLLLTMLLTTTSITTPIAAQEPLPANIQYENIDLNPEIEKQLSPAAQIKLEKALIKNSLEGLSFIVAIIGILIANKYVLTPYLEAYLIERINEGEQAFAAQYHADHDAHIANTPA